MTSTLMISTGSTEWVPLKEVKDSNPVELAKYAMANKIHEEPAFKWCVNVVLGSDTV